MTQSRLASLLAAPTTRQPIRIGDPDIMVSVETSPSLFGGSDPGLAEFALRKLARDLVSDTRDLATALAEPARHRLFHAPHRSDGQAFQPDIEDCGSVAAYRHSYMAELAEIVAGPDRDVLEIGFGLGVSATEIQRRGARSHSIIENHPQGIANFNRWRASHGAADIRLLAGDWRAVLDGSRQYDAILFDAYPLDEREWTEEFADPVTYARHFFATAARHLRPGGVFTYYSNETTSMSRPHQRALFAHFGRIELAVARAEGLPSERKHWQTSEYLIVVAREPRGLPE
jgi:predicted O-methyltransferase YrrM